MKLSTKIILSFTVVIFLIGGIGLISSYLNSSAKTQITNESRLAIREINLVGDLSRDLYQSITQTQYWLEDQYRQNLADDNMIVYMSSNAVKSKINESLANFRENLESINTLRSRDEYYGLNSSQIDDKIEQLEMKFEIYSSLLVQLQELSLNSELDGKEFFTITIEPYFRTSLIPILEDLQTMVQYNLDTEVAELNQNLEIYGQYLLWATLIALLISIGVSLFLLRSITKPLKELSMAAKDIGKGNLDKRIAVNTDDEVGQLSRSFNRMAESLNETTVSRNYVDSIIESMADMLIVTDEDYRISRVNWAFCNILGYKEHELEEESIYTFITFPSSELNTADVYKSEEGIAIRKNGEKFPVSLSKAKMLKDDQEVEGYVIVASDISNQKAAEAKITSSLKEKEILLAEIHHRVKNNLAVISGLLQMHIWEAENSFAESALKDSQMRVQSIALVHERLYQSDNLSHIAFDKYISDLLEGIGNIYFNESKSIKFKTDLEPIILNINQAIPCSLLINELVLNAYKHAFKNKNKGEISISLLEKNEYVYLTVQDDGRGFPLDDDGGDNGKKSLGMALVKTLVKQLDGEVNCKNKNGANIVVHFMQEDVVNNY